MAKQAHLDAVHADRAVNVRGNKMSEMHAEKPEGGGVNQMIKITVDGMDQAKFRCPRNMVSCPPDSPDRIAMLLIRKDVSVYQTLVTVQ